MDAASNRRGLDTQNARGLFRGHANPLDQEKGLSLSRRQGPECTEQFIASFRDGTRIVREVGVHPSMSQREPRASKRAPVEIESDAIGVRGW
jgi:hypothetical protein